MKHFSIIIAALLFSAGIVRAEVRLPHIFGSGMVLEQQSSIRLHGWSDRPGGRLRLTASWGEHRTARIADDGSWEIVIETPAASFEPQTLTLDDGSRLRLTDILIGTVWLCSGQSNMEMPVKGFWGCPVEGASDVVLAAPNTALRYFKVPRAAAEEPAGDTRGGAWQSASPRSVAEWSAVGYFFGATLQRTLGIPVGIVDSSWGGTCIESWIPLSRQQRFTDYDLRAEGTLDLPEGENYSRAASLYDGMIHPLQGFSFKGVAWYQGCSNTDRPTTYADKLATLIESWREMFGRKLPFFYVEIAPYDYGGGEAPDSYPGSGALLREQQQAVMSMVEGTGMVSTNDLVYDWERGQIHPRRKREVGERLALWALREYGYKTHALGLVFDRAEREGRAMRVYYKNADDRLSLEGQIRGFEVCGTDGRFYKAQARRDDFNSQTLTVWADEVEEPVAVRYCFRNFSPGNVRDNYGLPALPFRSDRPQR
ncbi:MAG: sialate O-acetylesterase [Alistipes sp.]|nr:sialate O-acetylesterase [Alistipes sp.]MBP3456027.1 sialate O-acetylesterase [Alistipes sp.]